LIAVLHRKSRRVLMEVDAERLAGANLAGAYLIHADLRDADLANTVLPFADLTGADLTGASLRGARLRGAKLVEADLTAADFAGADVTGATFGATVLHGCRNLHLAVGLETVAHRSPSPIDERTLAASAARLGDGFLRGLGHTRSEILRIRRAYPPEREDR